jgi:hypothetical protein
MVLQTTAIDRQGFISYHVVTTRDLNITTESGVLGDSCRAILLIDWFITQEYVTLPLLHNIPSKVVLLGSGNLLPMLVKLFEASVSALVAFAVTSSVLAIRLRFNTTFSGGKRKHEGCNKSGEHGGYPMWSHCAWKGNFWTQLPMLCYAEETCPCVPIL